MTQSKHHRLILACAYITHVLSREEHHKREAKSGTSCPFFRLEVDGSLAEQSKQKKKPARKSKAPKKAASGGDDDGDLEAAPVTVEPKATGACESWIETHVKL